MKMIFRNADIEQILQPKFSALFFYLSFILFSQNIVAQSWWSKLFNSDDQKDKYHNSIEKNQITPDINMYKSEEEFAISGQVLNLDAKLFQKIKLSNNSLDNFIEHLYVNKDLLIIHPAFGNIFLYNENGKFIKELTRKGRGPGEIEDLGDPVFSVFKDTTYVLSNGSISTFSKDGVNLHRQYLGSFARSIPLINENFIVTNNFAVNPKNIFTIYIYNKINYQHLYSLRFDSDDMLNIQPMSLKTDLTVTFDAHDVITFHTKNTSFFFDFDLRKKSIVKGYNIKHSFYKEPDKRKTLFNSIGDLMWYNRNYFSAYYSFKDGDYLVIFYSKDDDQEGVTASTSSLVVIADLRKREIIKQYKFQDFRPLSYCNKKIYMRFNNFNKINDEEMNTIYLFSIKL